MRLASTPPSLLFQDMRLDASICGAEANVAVALSGFGHDCRMVTSLPANPVGDAALHTFRSFGVNTDEIVSGQGRVGLFFLQPGAMTRPARITYDRAGSAFAEADPDSYNWDRILAGAEWLFVSGITAALGERALTALRKGVDAARGAGVKVAFDTNFRPTLWAEREALAAEIMREMAGKADLIFAGRRATGMIAGGSYDQADPDAGFAAAAQVMFDLCPNLSHMAATRRVVHSSDRQELTGLLADRSGFSRSDTVFLEAIVDRVGTGDAFAAGIVHGLSSDQTREASVRFATACAEWGHSVAGDFLRANLADIESLAQGQRDVKR